MYEKLKEKFAVDIVAAHAQHGDETIIIRREALLALARELKENPELGFNVLMDLSAVDYLKMERVPRFEVVYHFYSLQHKHRLRVKVGVGERDTTVDSLCNLYAAANWYEREVFDMFGVRFNGHPDLRRILMYEGFEGHPLRKDYPVHKRHPLIGPKN